MTAKPVTLLPHQIEATDAILKALTGRPIMGRPTGVGKSVSNNADQLIPTDPVFVRNRAWQDLLPLDQPARGTAAYADLVETLDAFLLAEETNDPSWVANIRRGYEFDYPELGA